MTYSTCPMFGSLGFGTGSAILSWLLFIFLFALIFWSVYYFIFKDLIQQNKRKGGQK
ncbi:hypothetical protein HN587_04430 [Candidatus Woesearchaeota archaeon]|jgi:hypothetical protein|nr:hypothetical protein [Candidatus Woesearchaeota archaeon]